MSNRDPAASDVAAIDAEQHEQGDELRDQRNIEAAQHVREPCEQENCVAHQKKIERRLRQLVDKLNRIT